MSALAVALLITELMTRVAVVASRAQKLLKTARDENRDITDEELASLASETDTIFDKLQKTD